MDCREYISDYLAAHADQQLSPRERRAAEAHLRGCANCRARLVEEHALKALLRRHLPIVRAPSDVRLRIRTLLGDAAEHDARRGPGRSAVPAPRRRRLGRYGLIGSLGLAAAAVLMLALYVGNLGPARSSRAAAVPAFDQAIAKFASFERDFVPNVPTDAYSTQANAQDGVVYAWVIDHPSVQRVGNDSADYDDLARSYRDANMPDDLLNFIAAGYGLAGGRVDHLPDGRPVTYTLYENQTGAILSICYRDAAMAAPIGAVDWLATHTFYRYHDFSICLTLYPNGHFVSIVIAQVPVDQLLRDVAAADASFADQ